LLTGVLEQISKHGTNGSAAPEVQEVKFREPRANYEPAQDVLNYASFAPPDTAGQQMEMAPR